MSVLYEYDIEKIVVYNQRQKKYNDVIMIKGKEYERIFEVGYPSYIWYRKVKKDKNKYNQKETFLTINGNRYVQTERVKIEKVSI